MLTGLLLCLGSYSTPYVFVHGLRRRDIVLSFLGPLNQFVLLWLLEYVGCFAVGPNSGRVLAT
jgi:bacteriorhodopsin